MVSCRTSLAWITVIALTSAGVPCPGELIVLKDGRVHVGFVKSEDSAAIRLTGGSASGATEVVIPRVGVERRCRGEEEKRRIQECQDPAVLEQWTASYFQAGLEDTADRCLDRIFESDAARVAEPKAVGMEAFRTYWNRMVLRRRAAGVAESDAAELLRVAKWARKAGLAEEARDYIRRASRADRESLEIPPLAVEWGVRLDPWIRLDLTLALQTSLGSEAIQDESVEVTPRKDMVFLTLPLHYDGETAAKTLTRNSFRGRDLQGFYGLRSVWLRGGRPYLDPRQESDSVFERMEIRIREQPEDPQDSLKNEPPTGPPDRHEIVGRNVLGPRKFEGTEEQRAEPKERTRPLGATGWLAVVVEIPKSQKLFTLEWADGVKEEVDLDFLSLVRQTLSDLTVGGEEEAAPPTSVPPPAVGLMLNKLTSPSTATACLALKRLTRLHEEIVSGAAPAWMAAVDAAVLTAGARPEEDLRSAAWSYFTLRRPVPKATMANLGRQSRHVQQQWIDLIAGEIKNSQPISASAPKGTPSTKGEAVPASGATSGPIATAVDLLGAALRSNNESVCDAALETLMGLGGNVDWGLAENASETSQAMALARLARLTDRAAAERLLRAIMMDVRPATAPSIAEHARRLKIGVASPQDALLTQWARTLDADVEERVALLTVLQAVDLGDIAYSRPFAELLDTAMDEGTSSPVREAADALLVEQAGLRWRKEIEERQRRSGVSRPPGAPDPAEFPTLVSIAAHDPLLIGLTRVASEGPRPLRVDALAILLLMGYAEEAENAIQKGAVGEAGPEALLKDLVTAHREAAYCDGLMALMGRMLRKEWLSSSEFVLTYLRDAVAGGERRDRWRLLAAVKAGVDFGQLNELGALLSPLSRVTHAMLLNELCHPTSQDRDRYQLQRDDAERMACLKRIDFRRGYLVEGRYGVLAIVETTVSEGRPAAAGYAKGEVSHYRWQVPQRVTIALPSLILATDETREAYRVLWGAQTIGEGRVKTAEGIQLPSRYSRRLEDPAEVFLGAAGWGWSNPANPAALLAPAVGPVILGERSVPTRLAPGTMTLDASSYLRAALRSQRTFGDEDIERLIPAPHRVALRYAAFGSFYGVGQRQPLPRRDTIWPGQRQLLNVMLVMERLEQSDIETPTTQNAATSQPTTQNAAASQPTTRPAPR